MSVIIKALNEEEHIEAAIISAIGGISGFGGEVILADTGSTDRTIEIARRFPVTIVQLADPGERCCGIGPQLGFQEAQSEFVYLMDGDMELAAGFLEVALAEFDRDPSLAGIGGIKEDVGDLNAEFRLKHLIGSSGDKPGPVSHLGGGGLYRTASVRAVGYFSNRNLHSFEELELGVRLNHAGWKLIRLQQVSIKHHCHQMGGYSILLRRWKSGFLMGSGECIHSALGKSYFFRIAPCFMFLYVTAAWLAVIVFIWLSTMNSNDRLGIFICVFLFPFVLLSVRYKDLGAAVYCMVSWVVSLPGAVRGFLRTQRDPDSPIARHLVQQGGRIPPQMGE
ncbi:MAG: glycosyltransferase [Candidatus Deferrimicrobium sp.]